MKKLAALVLLSGLLVSGCSKKGGVSDPTLFNNGFKGITQTTDDPTPIGWTDPDDWKSDGYWNFKYPIAQCGANTPVLWKLRPIAVDTVVEPIPILPKSFRLYPAFPNPGGPSIRFRFDLPRASHVYCAIIGDDYRIVAVLICDHAMAAGAYIVDWDGKNESGKFVPLDVYQCTFLVTDSQGGFEFASHGDVWVNY